MSEEMITDSMQSWIQDVDQSVLFIVDAGHDVERNILDKWLEQLCAIPNASAVIQPATKVQISISRSKGDLDLAELDQCLKGEQDLLLVPIRVVWLPEAVEEHVIRPRFRDLVLGDPRQPGPKRAKRILKYHPERVRPLAGKAATLEDLRQRFSDQLAKDPLHASDGFAAFVVRQASLALDIEERKLQGGRYKVPKFVAESLRADPGFEADLKKLAHDLGKSSVDINEEVDTYLKEMVTNPSTFYIDASARLYRFMSTLGYETSIECDEASVERTRQIVRSHPSVLLFTHKSHVDGAAQMSLIYEKDFPWPHILGGVNMAFAGLGFLLRRSGAIFIRRTFQDNPVYKLVLRHYLGYLMGKRFPLTWAFEGTRSRVGKLMPPRYGLLKYVLEAAHTTQAENLHIIPVAINYDMIGEAEDYVVMESGQAKRPESLKWFIEYLSSLRKPMGKIYLDFAEPVVLPAPVDPNDKLAISKIAFEVGLNANKVAPVTAVAISTMILLGAAPQALTAREALYQANGLVDWLKARNIRLAREIDLKDLSKVRAITRAMINNGLVNEYDEGPERVYGIDQDKHAEASYYRNTVIHYFVNKAILELALLKASYTDPAEAEQVFWAEAESIRDIFKFEFFYAPTERFRDELKAELALHDPDWEARLSQGPEALFALLNSQPLVAQSTLLPFIEAYAVVADLLARLKPQETLDEKTMISRAVKYARQAYLQRRISSKAGIMQLFFQNAYKLADNMQLVAKGDATVGRARIGLARKLKDLSRRVERIRALSMSQCHAAVGSEPEFWNELDDSAEFDASVKQNNPMQAVEVTDAPPKVITEQE